MPDGAQLTLDDALKSHAGDPPAARNAAKIAKAQAASHRGRILAHLAQEQSHGATYREVGLALGIEAAAANRRLSELHADGKVARLAVTRNSARGVACHIYTLPQWILKRETVD